MVICPDCGKDVKDAKFCSNCGALLPKVNEVVSEDISDNAPVVEPNVEVSEDISDDVPVVEPNVEVSEEVNDDVPVDEVEDITVETNEETIDETVNDSNDEIKPNANKKTKFCPNCGTEVDVGTVFCPKCGFKLIQQESQTKFCQSCGEKININAEICPHCGVRVANITSYGEKSTLLAAILSLFLPGLGHLYLGLNKKGISFIIAYIVSWVLVLILIGLVLIFIMWVWALIDSIKSTEALNRGEFVEDKLF